MIICTGFRYERVNFNLSLIYLFFVDKKNVNLSNLIIKYYIVHTKYTLKNNFIG